MKSQIRREINDFYQRYADECGLTYEQAAREMSRADLQEWRGTVGDYIEQIRREPNPQVRERLMREYDARSYNSRISRLDGLCGNIEMNVNNLYARADEQFRQLLGEEYTGGYYRAMYDLQTRLGYNGQFSTISREMVENTLAYPWSGANFSDRLWRNKTALVDTIRETLTQGMIRGDNIRDMSRAVADKLNSSFRNAERLVRTETSHIHNTAEIAAYEAAGYEEYEFMASLGERTCEVCGGLDGQHFKISEKQFGVNFPPVHPNCRCTTVGWEPEEKELPEGEQREELSYEEWYGKYVEGRGQEQLTDSHMGQERITKFSTQYIADNTKLVDNRPALYSENGDFLAFLHNEHLTDERLYAIIQSKRTDTVCHFRNSWEKQSLQATIARFFSNPTVVKTTYTGKIYYGSAESPYNIVYDGTFDYFRVIDTRKVGSRRYVDITGADASNKTMPNGTLCGRKQSEYNQATHFDNTDYRK